MKKIVTTLLALALCFSLTAPTALAATPWNSQVTWEWSSRYLGMNNFRRTRTYSAGVFSDVPAGAWYETGVQTLYEMGLLEGGRAFRPDGYLTLGEVVSLAVRIHSTYQSWVIPADQTDLDYALAVGIVAPQQYENYNSLATRRSFAAIMANALPGEALAGINTVIDNIIPDVPVGSPGGQAIYVLYRAGILLGGDSRGTFYPDELITRGAAAVAAARMADPTLRQGISLFAAEAAGVLLSQTALTLRVGESAYLTATVVPDNARNKNVIWTSSNPEIASVDSGGRVSGIAEGSAVISATAVNGIAVTCAVGVDAAPLDASDTGYYKDWPSVPDFGTLAGTAPVRVERSNLHTAYYYALDSFTKNDLLAYGEKVLSAGFLLDEQIDSGEGYEQMVYYKAGDPLRRQTLTYGQVGSFFVVRPGRTAV